jgi:CheY-like chemotaxis protein
MLPGALVEEQPRRPTPVKMPGGKMPIPAKRVLVVDDDIDIAETLADYLRENWPHRAHSVRGRGGAGGSLTRAGPRIIFIDIGLPGMDGYDLVRRLRANAVTKGAVVVALTGYVQEADRRRAKEAGFNHHVAKPFRIAMLDRLLASA